jgi:hypothetical protein
MAAPLAVRETHRRARQPWLGDAGDIFASIHEASIARPRHLGSWWKHGATVGTLAVTTAVPSLAILP